MSKTVQLKRGNANVSSTYTGAQGEITVNTTDYSINVHDGLTPGGFAIAPTGNLSLGNLRVNNQTITGTVNNAGIVLSPNNSSVFVNGNLSVSNVTQLNYNSTNNWAVLATNPSSLADMQIIAGNASFNSAIYLWSNLRRMSFNTLSNAFDFNFNGQLYATDFTASKNSSIGYSFYADGQGYSGFSHIAGPPDYIRIMHEGIDYARFYSNFTMNLTGNLIVSSVANLFGDFPDAFLQVYSNVNSYGQLVKQNKNNGTLASTDYVATADNGSDVTYFINMGITGSNHADPEFFGDTTSFNDGYLYSVGYDQAGPSNGNVGNLIIGSTNGVIKFFVGNTAEANVVARITSNALVPGANVLYSLGSQTEQWKDLWVSNIDTGIITLTNGAQIRDTAGNAVAIGASAGLTNQNNYAVAIGPAAGNDTQGVAAVAIGSDAGQTSQGIQAIAIGTVAGANAQSLAAVAIGSGAGQQSQGQFAVAIGASAGDYTQGPDAVAIGYQAGQTSQGEIAVAIGHLAGNTSQGNAAVAVGASAGANTQGVHAVAIGTDSGATTQGNRAVAIGYLAGSTAQGTAAVAIGYYAGELNQGNNSIIINATDTALQQTTANTFTVAPIRNDVANVAEILFYDTTSKEITYGNTISVAGNITGGNISTGQGLVQSLDITADGIINAGALNVNSSAVPGATGNIAGGNLSVTGNVTGNYFLGNGSQLTAVNAATVDILNTNGLTTVFYPTFVETRDNSQILRADVDLSYRTDTNTLTVNNISSSGNITGNTAGFAIGYRDIPQVIFNANSTLSTTDAGKHYYSTASGNLTLTIPNNASQAFSIGAAINVINLGTGNITIAQGAGVTLYLAGNATASNRTLSSYGAGTIQKVATDTWFLTGVGLT